jgi:hypothetical protein
MFKKILVLASLLAFMCANAYGGTVVTSSVKKSTWGNKRVVMGSVLFSGSYSSTAFAFTPRVIGLTKVDEVVFIPNSYTDAVYTPYITGTAPALYVNMYANRFNSSKASITAPAATDTFTVLTKALVAADAETCNVLVSPAYGNIARLVAPGIAASTINLALLHQSFGYADGTSYAGVVADSSLGTVFLRGADYKGGDTLFWDYNATSRLTRFMYSGTMMGDLGTLYVPLAGGHYLPIVKRDRGGSASSIARIGAYPVYFRPSAALEAKFQCDATGTTNVTTGAMVDTTYTALVQYNPSWAAIQSGTAISNSYYFIAIGN